MIALLAPAFGQPQEQKKVLSIADVAEQPASAPAWLTATRDYTRSNLRPNDSTISTVCSSHFLTAVSGRGDAVSNEHCPFPCGMRHPDRNLANHRGWRNRRRKGVEDHDRHRLRNNRSMESRFGIHRRRIYIRATHRAAQLVSASADGRRSIRRSCSRVRRSKSPAPPANPSGHWSSRAPQAVSARYGPDSTLHVRRRRQAYRTLLRST